tara:strand:- start:1889 stop:2665 length:777 start_codon:yes stop_codon:yes gene_type:complete
MTLTKKELIENIVDIALNSTRDKNLLGNIDNKLGASRYCEDCKLVTKNLSKNSKILDLGCGVGHMSYILYHQGFKNITASEIFDKEPLFLEYLKKEEGVAINYIKADILKENNFNEEKFDAILLCGVLEHVPDMRKFLKECFNLLVPGGKLFIQQFPNKSSLFEKINDLRGKSSHDIRLSKYELSLLLKFSEYKVEHCSYHQFLPYALNGFPKNLRNLYYRLAFFIRSLDKILFKTPIVRIGSTSIQCIGSKSTSCKS